MRWKLKATIQNSISLLPDSVSNAAYYWMQRRFGGLKNINPTDRLIGAIGTWKQIKASGYDPLGKVFFEIGTGRVPMVPVAYWLMGAEKTITVDLNPYLKAELTNDCIQYIAHNKAEVIEFFGELLDNNRFEQLMQFNNQSDFSMEALFGLCGIEYFSPADASQLPLAAECIDIYTSYNVFEHIPTTVLQNILKEGNRVIKPNGLFAHRIDYSDHFANADPSISAINFLQYSDAEWAKYADNGYMYMNRLRHDDFLQLFEAAAQAIVTITPTVSQDCLALLTRGDFPLDAKFKEKSTELLAITGTWITTKLNVT